MAATDMSSPSESIHEQSDPVVIDEHNHPIRMKMLDQDAVHVMRKLNKAGFSSYLVGGGVRDLYLGRTPKDFDISTDAKPGQIRKLFPNSATIGRRFRLVQIFFRSGKIIEVSTLRSLSEHDLDGPESVLAPNNTYGNLPEDAQRRDLSINSLFYNIENHSIIDYVGGVQDLDASIIRITGEPDIRINRDPVRMMRAIRHSARTNFTIEDKTWASICKNHSKLNLCPPSRIRDELFKDMYGGAAQHWFKLAVDCEIFSTLFPFYKETLFKSDSQGKSPKEKIHTSFSILDALNTLPTKSKKGTKLPQHFILALILLPWAEHKYKLSTLHLKGPAFYKLSRKIRSDIDNYLGSHLNLKKSIRQEITTLLSNLPNFVRLGHNDTWPKWLRKKSYFKKGLLFFQFNKAATNNQSPEKSAKTIVSLLQNNRGATTNNDDFSKRKTAPAISNKKKEGIFGLKK